MKLLFKNNTRYSEEVYKEFLSFHQNKYQFRYTLYTFVIAMLLIMFLIVQIKSYNYTFAIIFCVAITIFILWRFFHPVKIVNDELNSEKIKKEKAFTFKFYDKSFEVSNMVEYSTMKYYKLKKVFETKKYFYLYIDKRHAFILDKNGFKKGDIATFSDFIKKKCLFKYKKYEKSSTLG